MWSKYDYRSTTSTTKEKKQPTSYTIMNLITMHTLTNMNSSRRIIINIYENPNSHNKI